MVEHVGAVHVVEGLSWRLIMVGKARRFPRIGPHGKGKCSTASLAFGRVIHIDVERQALAGAYIFLRVREGKEQMEGEETSNDSHGGEVL